MRALMVGLALLVPLAVPQQYLVTLAMLTVTSAALGQAWNLAGGFGGMTSFGHVAFFGLGAYVAAIGQLHFGLSPWLGLPLAALVGGAAGAAMGAAAFRARLRGSYFALVTLAVAEALRVLANSLDITGAGVGLQLRLAPGLAQFQFVDRRLSYLAALILLGLTMAASVPGLPPCVRARRQRAHWASMWCGSRPRRWRCPAR